MNNIIIRRFEASDAPWLVAQHRALYARDEGFDDSFGDLVAEILRAFTADHDPVREHGWVAVENGQRLGSIFCVSQGATTAKLRLFLLVPQARGKGLGKQLLNTCTGFARDAGYTKMVLWTHESHRAACALYTAMGWTLVSSCPEHSFGVDVIEQHWETAL